MKKSAIALSLLLTMSLSTAAFADEGDLNLAVLGEEIKIIDGTIELDLTEEKPIVEAEIFSAIAGRDVTLQVRTELGLWTVSGLDIPVDAEFEDLDFGIELGGDSVPAPLVANLADGREDLQIEIMHDNEFPFPVTLNIMPTIPEGANYANLYFYDEEYDVLTFTQVLKPTEKGEIIIDFEYASSYVIIFDTRNHTPVIMSFSDVSKDSWYYDAVEYSLQNNLLTGVTETTFEPDTVMTRGMLVTALYRMEGEPEVEAMFSNFVDVDYGSWYKDAIGWAAKSGIAGGVGDRMFMPDQPLTREEMVTMLYRYEQLKGGGFTGVWAYKLPYDDSGFVAIWAYESMSWFIMNDLISGVGENLLAPKEQATRAQVATTLMRYLEF